MPPTRSTNSAVCANLSPYSEEYDLDYSNTDTYRSQGAKISRQRAVTGNNRNGVTRAFWGTFAVCPYRQLQSQDFAALDELLRQKPTRIERGVPVGTKGLDRRAELREFCAGPQSVRAMRGAMRV